MSPKQTQLYWREWACVVRARRARGEDASDAVRKELHKRALGKEKSSKELNNRDFDAVLGVFRAESQSANVAAQVRQIRQPRARLLGKVAELVACLELYHPDADGYVREIIRDKFCGGSVLKVEKVTDLSSEPRMMWDRRTGKDEERPSQLLQLVMTLERAVNGRAGYRAGACDSVHDMKMKAGLKCDCMICSSPLDPRHLSKELQRLVTPDGTEGDQA